MLELIGVSGRAEGYGYWFSKRGTLALRCERNGTKLMAGKLAIR